MHQTEDFSSSWPTSNQSSQKGPSFQTRHLERRGPIHSKIDPSNWTLRKNVQVNLTKELYLVQLLWLWWVWRAPLPGSFWTISRHLQRDQEQWTLNSFVQSFSRSALRKQKACQIFRELHSLCLWVACQFFPKFVWSYIKYHCWPFISKSRLKSSSQYLKIVEAIRWTFCFFSTSISCICFLIAANRSLICFSSLFPASDISSWWETPFSMARTFNSFKVWVRLFIFNWPFVSCWRTLFFWLFMVPMVLIGWEVRFRALSILFWGGQCSFESWWLQTWEFISFCCSFKSAWSTSSLSVHFFPQIQSTPGFNSTESPGLCRVCPFPPPTALSSHFGHWCHSLCKSSLTLLFDKILHVSDLFFKLFVDLRDLLESPLVVLHSMSSFHLNI